MAAKPVKVAFIADTADLRAGLDKAQASMDSAAATAKSAGAKIESSFDSAGAAADGVASTSAQVAGGLGDLGGALEATGFISEGTAQAMNTASAAIMGVTGVSDLANAAFEKLKLGTLASKAATVAQTVATNTAAAAQRVLNAVMRANPIGIVITAIVLLVGALVLAYKKSETFREIVDKSWGAIKNATSAVFDWVRDKIARVFDLIKTIFLNFTGPGLIIKHWDTIRDKTRDAFEAVKNFITDKLGAAKDKVGEIVGDVVGLFGGIKDKITAKTSGMWDGIGSSFKGVINSIIGWWNNLSFSLDIPNKIPGLPDSFSISTPNIPYLAAGGVVTRPTLAVVGEAGPEAVIPLSKLGGFGGGALTVRIDLGAEEMAQLERGRRVAADLRAYTAAGGRL